MKTKLLIIIGISVTVFLIGTIIYPYINETSFDDDNPHDIPTALSNIPQIHQNDMFCWTQWHMQNTIIDEEKLISSLRSTISMFGSDFDVPNREITIKNNDEETIISIGGSWTKDQIHHEKLTSIIKDHIGDSQIIRDDIVMCT
ncbi:hypothetical protein [Nitrosopumilus sp.]|uniref:hypothetical protein n=1 Tax=Nitrosopumilus sp. TaxID=2024843 RepID=UPI0034A07AF5